MNLYKLNCNNCGSHLNIDFDNLQAYCPFCGQKLMIDFEQLGRIIKERELTKRITIQEEHKTQRKKMEYEEGRKNSKSRIFFFAIIFICWLCLFFLVFNIFNKDDYSDNHSKKVEELICLEKEIEEDIINGNYEVAELKVNRLRLSDNYSKTETQSWDEKREYYLKIINERRNKEQ